MMSSSSSTATNAYTPSEEISYFGNDNWPLVILVLAVFFFVFLILPLLFLIEHVREALKKRRPQVSPSEMENDTTDDVEVEDIGVNSTAVITTKDVGTQPTCVDERLSKIIKRKQVEQGTVPMEDAILVDEAVGTDSEIFESPEVISVQNNDLSDVIKVEDRAAGSSDPEIFQDMLETGERNVPSKERSNEPEDDFHEEFKNDDFDMATSSSQMPLADAIKDDSGANSELLLDKPAVNTDTGLEKLNLDAHSEVFGTPFVTPVQTEDLADANEDASLKTEETPILDTDSATFPPPIVIPEQNEDLGLETEIGDDPGTDNNTKSDVIEVPIDDDNIIDKDEDAVSGANSDIFQNKLDKPESSNNLENKGSKSKDKSPIPSSSKNPFIDANNDASFPTEETDPYDKFIRDVVFYHNFHRTQHDVPPLTLSPDLCRMAKEWANFIAEKGTMDHSTYKYGENIYWNKGTVTEGKVPVEYWYSQMKNYDWENNNLQKGTGPFTQAIWKSSKDIGVAKAHSEKGTFVVVLYDPIGNTHCDFADNVFRPKF